MELLIALVFIVGLVVAFDIAALTFGTDSRESFADARFRDAGFRPGFSIR